MRYEQVRSETTDNIIGADTNTLVPRVAATWDIRGNGRLVAQGTWGHYSGRYSEAQFAGNSDVGNPSLLWYVYTGPRGPGPGLRAWSRSGQLHARSRSATSRPQT